MHYPRILVPVGGTMCVIYNNRRSGCVTQLHTGVGITDRFDFFLFTLLDVFLCADLRCSTVCHARPVETALFGSSAIFVTAYRRGSPQFLHGFPQIAKNARHARHDRGGRSGLEQLVRMRPARRIVCKLQNSRSTLDGGRKGWNSTDAGATG